MSSRGSGSTRVRSKVAALLISLAALWAFAAFVTFREGVNLLFVSTLDKGVAQPLEMLLPALQQERKVTLVYLGGGTAPQRQEMQRQRQATDEAIAAFQELAKSGSVAFASSDALDRDLALTFAQLDGLSAVRGDIDGGRIVGRPAAVGKYTAVLDTIFALYSSAGAVDDKEIAADVATLIDMTRVREVLAQEDALVSGALAAGNLTDSERESFAQLVGAQRFLRAEAASKLPDEDHTMYQELVSGSTFTTFEALETTIIQGGRQNTRPTVTLDQWNAAITPVHQDFTTFVETAGDSVVARATPMAIGVIVRLALAGGLGMIAVIASIVISITTARALVQQLERLRNAARDLASYRLPRVVERLQHGEKVDVESEAPPLDFGRDEIGQVGQAFNDVQSTAIRVAVEQAELRRSVRDVFLSLARRSQALLHRQLGLLDAMERRSTDAEELAELFRIDHLATRMRRNAENLIVLSGATAGRAWRKPVPMVDVLRGALAEVEDYTRVTVLPVVPASLVGRAVGDVIHLLAELIENAVSFSPPQTVVRVGGSVVGNGFAIEIEDRGLGMSEEDRTLANEQLNDPPEFKLSSTARLGLYVVGKLAERHGIRVKLAESPYGGTTAIVLLPATLMAEDGAEGRHDSSQFDANGSQPWASLTSGRHRHDLDDDERLALSDGPRLSPSTRTAALALEPFAESVPLNGSYVPPSFVTSVSGVDQATGAATIDPAAAAEDVPIAGLGGESVGRSEPTILTPSGLPWRQRGKGLVQPPSTGSAGAPSHPPATPTTPTSTPTSAPTSLPTNSPIGRASRGPEEARSIMSSYRSGTLRGRIDAARLNDTSHAPEWTQATQESHRTDEEGCPK
jgi:signal transduction histidine kinase